MHGRRHGGVRPAAPFASRDCSAGHRASTTPPRRIGATRFPRPSPSSIETRASPVAHRWAHKSSATRSAGSSTQSPRRSSGRRPRTCPAPIGRGWRVRSNLRLTTAHSQRRVGEFEGSKHYRIHTVRHPAPVPRHDAQFVDERIAPNAAEADRTATYPWKSFEACKELELPALGTPAA